MNASRHVIPMSDDAKRITSKDLAPTVFPDAFLESDVAAAALELALPAYDRLPDIPLYREQVISYVEKVLTPLLHASEDAWLTPAMINNYVKMGLVTPPQKKTYGREQVAQLLVICIFKQFLPIAAIQKLLRIQRMTYPVDVAYDYVAAEVNNAVHAAFKPADGPVEDTAHVVTRESLLVRNAATAFAAKALLMAYLRFAGYEE